MLFAAGISLGLFFSLNRIATTGGIPFIATVFWLSLGAGLLLLILAVATNNRPRLTLAHLRIYVLFGTVGMALPYLLLAFVAPKLPAGVVGLQQTLVPVMTYVFALLFQIDRMQALKLIGLATGLAAVLLVVVPQASLPEPGMAGWVLLNLLVPVCFALSNVLAAVLRPPETPSLPLSAGIMLAGAAFLFPVMAGTGSWWWFEGAMDVADWALIGVTAINALFFFLLLEIIRRAGPVFFSVQNYIATLSGIAWGMLILGEGHSAWIWGALVLLFVALTLVVRGSARENATAP
jgi:drug/metabolite transporter (DMT)-like permease